MKYISFIPILALFFGNGLQAEIWVPRIFSDHMVLQREVENPVWGRAAPGSEVRVGIAGNMITVVADEDGDWRGTLPALSAGGPYTLTFEADTLVEVKDVLVGEVWLCSGQSNMEWRVNQSDASEVEQVSANFPQIRMLRMKKVGTQTPQDDLEGEWAVCSPDTAGGFSAVGYFFGRRLHNALGVPIGLIDNSWGGSAAEAWVPRDALEASGDYAALLEHWDEKVAAFDRGEFELRREEYFAWDRAGRPEPKLSWPKDYELGQHRPSNIYYGMLHPILGYGIRGVIWYQGETNSGRSAQHLDLFPFLVETWRERWGQGDFPFYWVQLADFGSEADEPQEHSWAEFRDSQTSSMDVIPNSGQAVIIDAGEGRDIHPRDKQTVASRLSRWPLAKVYGFDIAYQSPRYSGMQLKGSKIHIRLDHVSEEGLWSFDTEEIVGFAIAGEDRKFVWAQARILEDNTIEVWSDQVEAPVAVRYGWGMNPRVNLYDRNGLPVTPFRTDDWPWTTEDNVY